MILSDDQFDLIRRLLVERTGVVLEDDQIRFTAGRLLPVAQKRKWNDLAPLVAQLRDRHDQALAQEVIEALVTHETSFFRDPHYFDELTDQVLPQLFARRAGERRLSIWCAACSTGQEPYSIAMILRERFPQHLAEWNVQILATDLSATALHQAKSGLFSEVEINRGVSEIRRAQHFTRESTCWRIDHRLMQLMRFQQLNLIDAWPAMPAHDLILLRNVLIYMSRETRQTILQRIQTSLRPDGRLMLGSSESTLSRNLSIACVCGSTAS